MNVPLFDPAPQHALVRDEIQQAVSEVLDSGHFIMGRHVQAFEKEVAAYHGVKHALGVASGTDALQLALLAAGIGAGDEVITTPFTFIATLEAIYHCGATPVFADVEPDTMNIDPVAVESVMTERTRAIIPVHLFGRPAAMTPLLNLAQSWGIKVIGDCAQAFGAHYEGISVGKLGDAGCFSFFPSKNLGGYGDGGLITTDSDELADTVRLLRNHGSQTRYYHDEVGFNSRLDEIQAAALRVKLRHLETFNEQRRRLAARYNQSFADLNMTLPLADPPYYHVYGQYSVQVHERDLLRAALEEAGIGTAIYYPVPLHRQNVCRGAFAGQSFPACERLASTCLSLPMFPGLADQQLNHVVATVRNNMGEPGRRAV